MKLLMCRDLKLGAICTANLSPEQAREWNIARYRKFEHLLHTAEKEDCPYVVVFGKMFGSPIVSGEYTDALNGLIKKRGSLKVITCLNEEDSRRLASSSTGPENLHVVYPSIRDSHEEEDARFTIDEEGLHIEDLKLHSSLTVNLETMRITSTGERLPAFEPCGYEDALKETFGYTAARITEAGVRSELRPSTIYAFRFLRMTVTPNEKEEEILTRSARLVSANDRDTFVRLVIGGTTGIGVKLNAAAIREKLMEHVFYAEVYDKSSIDLSGYNPDTDISLANEFVRLAMLDSSLSDQELSAVIRTGWNALKETEEAE